MNRDSIKKYAKQYGIKMLIKPWLLGRINKNEKMHLVYRTYIESKYDSIIEQYRVRESILSPKAEPSCRIVWVLWWEGLDEMPDVVRHCISSIKKHAAGYEVVVLSGENYNQYVQLPNHIIEHFKNGDIEIVHMADILRVFLLCQQGGIWLDATVFLSDDLPEDYLNKPFFSRNNGNLTSKFASKGRWAGYFMAVSHSHTVLFDFLQDMYTEYWKDHNIILCYFLLDYFLLIAHDRIKIVGEIIDNIPINNTQVQSLAAKLNEPYEENSWKRIQKDTILHKLTWKKELYRELSGQETFYGHVVARITEEE